MPRRLKIALVNLASDKDNWGIMMVPLGLQYLAAALRKRLGDRVDVTMGDMGLIPKQTDVRPIVQAYLADLKPDIVGLRGFSTQADAYPLVAKAAKHERPDCLVVAGGPHAATRSPSLFDETAIDLVVPLEGEITFTEIVQAVLEGRDPREVPGVEWHDDSGRGAAPPRALIDDLDSIEFPDYRGIDIDAYQGYLTMTGLRPKGKATSLFTTRGCYFRCTYCHDHFGKAVRKRSLDDVFAEMEGLMNERGVTEFQIIDDIFNADRPRAIAFFDRVVKLGWDLNFSFPNGLRGDLITEEFVAAAKAAGAYHWSLAIESASPRIQKLVQKHNKLDRLMNAITLSDRYGVFTSTFTMLGFPTETREEMQMTVDFLLSSKAHMALMFHVQPFEGTEIREQVQQLTSGRMDGEFGYSSVVSDSATWFTEIPPQEIREIIVDTSWRFHFDPQRMRRMKDLTATCHAASALAEYLHFCLGECGYDLSTMPAGEARTILDSLVQHQGSVPYEQWVPPVRLHELAALNEEHRNANPLASG
ncbi:MAG: B12-binding domain-containing radical SAM protein [Planctomycetes bacterium]|nr:B12-binding domain-containing radical SAM protein [Planctomycetota bacterium]